MKENQQVQAGDVLVRIDPADLQAKVDQEQAALLNAEAAVAVAQAAVASARATVVGSQAKVASNQADVTAARTRAEQTAADLARYQAAAEQGGDLPAAVRRREGGRRFRPRRRRGRPRDHRVVPGHGDVRRPQIEAATRQVAAAQAQVAQHQAALEAARLQLSYATVKAPVAGIVSKKSVEVGQFVQAGQPLLAIVQGHGRAWVSANFKETQLARMRAGPDGRDRGGRLPRRDLPRPGRVARRGHRRPVLAAAARQRDRQLHQGRAARAGEDRRSPIRRIRGARCAWA